MERPRWPPSASSTSSPPDVRTAPASSSTSTSCATISAPSPRRCPTTRIFYAVKANPAPEILRLLAAHRLVLRHRLRCRRSRWRWTPARRPTASPSATPSRRSATSRAPIALGIRALRRRLRRGSREDRPRRARRARVLPRPDRRRGRRMAAVAQVRLRAGDGRRRAAPRPALGLDAYGVSFHVGSQQTDLDAWDRALARRQAGVPRRSPSDGIALEDGQYGRRLPDPLPEGRAGGAGLRPGDLRGAAQAFRQRTSRRPSSSRAAAWSAMPASSRRKSC